MNQEQRKFLISKVESTCNKQIKELEKTIPEKPSLNNYLIAAFLDNSIKFNNIEKLKIKIREKVLKLGSEERLIEQDRYSDNEPEIPMIRIIAEDIFVIPDNYIEALKKFEFKKEEIEKKIKILEQAKDTIVMKLQIGSSAFLDKIITQVDNIGDLQLMNTQLLLSND